MKKWVISLGVLGAVAVLVSSQAEQAAAQAQYLKAFKKLYVKDGTPLAEAVDKTKCNVCHFGNSKKSRNDYGKAIGKLITPKEKDQEKITKVLEDVAKEHSDPKNPSSPTFAQLFEQGKLPEPPK